MPADPRAKATADAISWWGTLTYPEKERIVTRAFDTGGWTKKPQNKLEWIEVKRMEPLSPAQCETVLMLREILLCAVSGEGFYEALQKYGFNPDSETLWAQVYRAVDPLVSIADRSRGQLREEMKLLLDKETR